MADFTGVLSEIHKKQTERQIGFRTTNVIIKNLKTIQQ